MTDTPLLEVEGLTVTFGRSTHAAVHAMDLTLDRGQIVVILGESGSGKTVFSRVAAGLPPTGAAASGTSRFDGIDLVRLGHAPLRKLLGRRIAFVPQDPASSLDPMRRVGGQITEVLRQHGVVSSRKEARSRMIESLERVRIPAPEQTSAKYPHELSGGMRQRIAIAIAIACDPELIVADEPSSALDASVGAHIVDLLAELRSRTGTSLIFITHDIGVAARIARGANDQVVVMLRGCAVERGPARDVLSDPRHPYTQALLAAEPSANVPRGHLATVPSAVREAHWGALREVARYHWVAEVATERASR